MTNDVKKANALKEMCTYSSRPVFSVSRSRLLNSLPFDMIYRSALNGLMHYSLQHFLDVMFDWFLNFQFTADIKNFFLQIILVESCGG